MPASLLYVIGASGSGKDSLICYARERLAHDSRVCFAHRYITRPADAGGENHVALTAEEFTARREARLFAMHWHSHGLAYGIGIEINQWLAKGITVVVNGSRAALPIVASHYSEILPVWIEVSEAVLHRRLLARGRESVEQVEERLRRHRELKGQPRQGVVVHNDGALEDAGQRLVDLIRRHCGVKVCA